MLAKNEKLAGVTAEEEEEEGEPADAEDLDDTKEEDDQELKAPDEPEDPASTPPLTQVTPPEPKKSKKERKIDFYEIIRKVGGEDCLKQFKQFENNLKTAPPSSTVEATTVTTHPPIVTIPKPTEPVPLVDNSNLLTVSNP